MSSKKTLISVAVGTAFAASMAAAPVTFAAENPFALQSLDKGYMVSDNNAAKSKAMKEGLCGEGKCGNMKMGHGQCGMAMADTNKDGKVSQQEFTTHNTTMFGTMDANKDGFIDKKEMGSASKMMHDKDHSKHMDGKSGTHK